MRILMIFSFICFVSIISCENNNSSVVLPESQLRFNKVIGEIHEYYNKNELIAAEHLDSSIRCFNQMVDSTLALSWIGILDGYDIDPNYTFGGKTFVKIDFNIKEGMPSKATFSVSSFFSKDSLANNTFYQQLRRGDYKDGDTIVFDGIFNLNNSIERVAVGSSGPISKQTDFISPWLEFEVTSISPYPLIKDIKLDSAKSLTKFAYLAAKWVATKKEYDVDGLRISLDKMDKYRAENLTENEIKEVVYLQGRRVLREILLIK